MNASIHFKYTVLLYYVPQPLFLESKSFRSLELRLRWLVEIGMLLQDRARGKAFVWKCVRIYGFPCSLLNQVYATHIEKAVDRQQVRIFMNNHYAVGTYNFVSSILQQISHCHQSALNDCSSVGNSLHDFFLVALSPIVASEEGLSAILEKKS
jgi:hypothetical protein